MLTGMTPRHGLTAVAFLFLALPVLAAPAPEDCPFKYIPKEKDAEWLVPPKAECDFLTSLEADVAKLAAAAGFAKTQAALSRFAPVEPHFNAYADAGEVIVNDKFVKRLIRNRPAALWVLAHEVGHLVQYRDGEGAKRDEVWKSTGEGKAWNDFNRIFESQADRIAGELMARAGYPVRDAAAVEAALGGDDFALRSEHTHPANGIRWLEALKQQQKLEVDQHLAARQAVSRRARALMSRPAFDRDASVREDNDNRTPMEWGASARAAPYAYPKKYAAGAKLEEFNAQGRLTSKKYPVFAVDVPPLSAAPAPERDKPGVEDLSLSDRLVLRARTVGPQSSYAAAFWNGAYDWFLDGGWWRKSENPAKPKPAEAGAKP